MRRIWFDGEAWSRGSGAARWQWLLLAGLLVAASGTAAVAAQCGITGPAVRFPANAQGVAIATSATADALLFRLRPGQMSLDLDGNEHTYGVRDQGLDGICNGLSALDPPDCAGVTPRGRCFAACQAALRAWDRTPDGARRLFCSVGLGSGCGATFSAPLQTGDNAAFFVSETATKYAPPPGAARTWIQTQAAQIDPLAVPFFVLPPALRRLPFDASPGDAGVMVRTDGARPPAFFIIGDSGNNGEIGESSARLHQLLSRSGTLRTKTETSAFGESVARTAVDGSPEVAVAIFRHSAVRPGDAGSLIQLTRDTVVDWINRTGADRLARLGDADALIACAPRPEGND